MNRLYTSNRNELLCEKLAENINIQSGSLFNKTMIITQGGGMNDWLTGELTRCNGVFSHYEFQNQDGFLRTVYELLTGKKLKSNRDAIKFGVYRLLNTKEFTEKFSDVAYYYKDNDLRRIQLAEKVADLFDQYQLYRGEMIRKWDSGQMGSDKPQSEKWQMWLWQKLEISSKESIRDKIYDILQTDAEILKETFPEIHLFGLSIYTNFHKDFYIQLGEYIKVNFYVCLPSPAEKHKHTLLESNGSKAKELLQQFSKLERELTEFHVEYNGTLLARLQQSILNNEELTEKETDDSIQITSHYTPVREVEGLYNYLLNLFIEDKETKSLKPRDVLVITPDINTYEPFVKAVFRNAPVELPFRVSGAARNSGNTITASLELLINMNEEDLTAENVVGLLEQNRIGKAYEVSDTSYIRGVVNKAGIRFGRENRLEDDTHYVSWKYGLEKIILGYAMHTEAAFDVSYRLTEDEQQYLGEESLTNYPYQDAEASASYDLLRLKAFVDGLLDLFDEQQKPRTLSAWIGLFQEKILGKMVWSSKFVKDDREELKEIFRALKFTENLDEDLAGEEVRWEVFVNELRKRLFAETITHELNTGAITFTSAIPARGLPYKIIAFMGLDNGAFPRQDHHLGFDLMGNDYQPGDRSKKEADKSLFLDTLMAVREKLYLSYIGQSVKDNSQIPPSIVLDTLMYYLGMKPVQHPLHGFSSRYNQAVDSSGSDNSKKTEKEAKTENNKEDDKAKLFTYLYITEPDDDVYKTEESDKTAGKELTEIRVSDFVKFFEAPIDWYFNKVLGIKYNGDEDDTLPDTELFDLDHLQKWKIKTELLKHKDISEDALKPFTIERIKKGQLPLRNLGRATVEELLKDIDLVKHKYHELTEGKEARSASIDLSVNGLRIVGTIDSIFDGEYIHVSTSSSGSIEKYKVRACLNALLLYASGEIKAARLLGLKKVNSNITLVNEPYISIDQEIAMQKLSELVEFFVKGKEQPLVFSLSAAKPPGKEKPITIESVVDALKKETKDRTYVDPPIPANKYILKLMDERYFDNLTEENIEDIRTLAGLLNL